MLKRKHQMEYLLYMSKFNVVTYPKLSEANNCYSEERFRVNIKLKGHMRDSIDLTSVKDAYRVESP